MRKGFLKFILGFIVAIIIIFGLRFLLDVDVYTDIINIFTKVDKDTSVKDIDKDILLRGFIPDEVNVGDTVSFGSYFDIRDDSDEELTFVKLKWDVIAKATDSVLLITDDIIENVRYNDTWNPISWEECSVRKWLNEVFYSLAFTDEEQKYILDSHIKNDANPRFNTKAGEDTIDKVFLLSIDELNAYYKTNAERQAKGTRHAIREGLWVSRLGTSEGYSVWWLRSPGKTISLASLVHAGGALGDIGDSISTIGNGVRPCIWVKIK